jgi:hypothetical protein|nr:MAG TPA_asm: ATPase [Caudoviricetes sp.]DAR18632.1 MAG TPA: ATPase [Caudoviricetes sp.]
MLQTMFLMLCSYAMGIASVIIYKALKKNK